MESEKEGAVEAVSSVPAPAALDIDALYRAHAAFLARALWRLCGGGAHVDDLLQETFVVAWKKRTGFDATRDARPWLYGIAANLARRHRRSLFRRTRATERLSQEPPPSAEGPDAAIDRQQQRAAVHAVLQRLPFKQREVFVLYELESMEGAEIAALVGVPIGTVWTRLHHGRARFTALMSKEVRR